HRRRQQTGLPPLHRAPARAVPGDPPPPPPPPPRPSPRPAYLALGRGKRPAWPRRGASPAAALGGASAGGGAPDICRHHRGVLSRGPGFPSVARRCAREDARLPPPPAAAAGRRRRRRRPPPPPPPAAAAAAAGRRRRRRRRPPPPAAALPLGHQVCPWDTRSTPATGDGSKRVSPLCTARPRAPCRETRRRRRRRRRGQAPAPRIGPGTRAEGSRGRARGPGGASLARARSAPPGWRHAALSPAAPAPGPRVSGLGPARRRARGRTALARAPRA
ncbi:unnamed protein product, partial [Coccothraustes coccothraustes]